MGHGIKTIPSIKLSVQSTRDSHISKGIWVAKAIAGGELCVFRQYIFMKKEWGYIKGIFILFGVPAIMYGVVVWNPVLHCWDGEFYIAIWVIVIPYWVALFYVHKHWSNSEDFKDFIKILLGENVSKEEKERIKKELEKRGIGYK